MSLILTKIFHNPLFYTAQSDTRIIMSKNKITKDVKEEINEAEKEKLVVSIELVF